MPKNKSRQQRWVRGAKYEVTGASGRGRKMVYVDDLKVGDDTLRVFRQLYSKTEKRRQRLRD